MDDIHEQIRELVKKNMPEAQAIAFKEFIEEAEKVKKDYIDAEKQIEELKESVLVITRTKRDLEAQVQLQNDIEYERRELQAERTLFEEEKRDLRVTMLESKLADACTLVNAQQNIVASIFKHGNTRDMMLSANFNYDSNEQDGYGNSTGKQTYANGNITAKAAKTEEL